MKSESVPQVTIVLAAFNAETHLREAIGSILSQTFSDFEFLIVDDGSTDGTRDIVLTYDDYRFFYTGTQETIRPSAK